MKEYPLYTIDAFANKPFSGNSAAICLVGSSPLEECTMQSMAAEMNISETAFIELLGAKDNYATSSKFKLRWFTPTNEVPLCGHATLAAAAVLFFKCKNPNPAVTFSTLSGDLFCKQNGDYITLDLPLNEPQNVTTDERNLYNIDEQLAILLGKQFKDHIENLAISHNLKKLVVRLKNECTRSFLESIAPDIEKMLLNHDGSFYKGIIVTVTADNEDHDFYSRYFAPWNGINEDPVTGSAHTVLGPYWGKILNKQTLFARQCSKRGGNLKISLRSDGRIDVAGNAVCVISGSITV